MPDSFDRAPAQGFLVCLPRIFFAESKRGQHPRSGPQGSLNLLPAFGTFAGMMNRETESITATLLWEERAIRFSTLAAALVLLADIPEAEARRMPRYPAVPTIRLAVASAFQGQHIGSLLVLDVLRRSCCNELAWAIFLVDAKEEQTVAFYEKFLFKRFAQRPLSLWIHRKQAERIAGLRKMK